MGAWGNGPFDNDEAADFVYDYEERGAAAVENALTIVKKNFTYLEASEASVAIAAAAIVAAAAGHTDELSEPALAAFSNRNDQRDLLRLKDNAREALDRILAPQSELLELWEEAGSDQLKSFRESVVKLRANLD